MEILKIENKAGKVRLNESVNPDSMSRLIEEIGQVFGAQAVANGANFGEITNCIENAADTLDLEIHSPGGSVLDGYKLYHAILELRGRGVYVTATINSLAASMASVIAMAADKIRMVKGGKMMIHEASNAIAGNAEDFARMAKLLDEISGEIAEIYAGKTGAKPEEMRDLMRKETWMGADEAKERGFIDEIQGAKFDTTKKKSMNILDRLTTPAAPEALAKIEELENAAQAHDGIVAELNGKLEIAENALQGAATEAAELRNSITGLKEEIETLKAEASKVPDLEAAAKITEEKVKVEAANVAASIGLAAPLEDANNTSTQAASKTPHLDKFNELKGGEATAYFKEFKKQINAEARIK